MVICTAAGGFASKLWRFTKRARFICEITGENVSMGTVHRVWFQNADSVSLMEFILPILTEGA